VFTVQFGLIGPLLALVCMVLTVAGLAATAAAAFRHGARGLVGASPAGLGGLLVWGWFVMFVGVRESVWSMGSPSAWIAGGVGTLGCLL